MMAPGALERAPGLLLVTVRHDDRGVQADHGHAAQIPPGHLRRRNATVPRPDQRPYVTAGLRPGLADPGQGFASPARLAAWAGLAPGDNESAGKRKKAAARKGNPHLRSAMVEAAWAVSRTATRPGARFRRLARRFGRLSINKAAVAVAHTLLCIAWAVMKHDADYAEAGADYYDQRDQRNLEYPARHHQQALARLGYQVALLPPADASPPPATGGTSP